MKKYLTDKGHDFLPDDISKKLCSTNYKFIKTGNYTIFEDINKRAKDIYIIHYNYFYRKTNLFYLESYSYDIYYITKEDYEKYMDELNFKPKTNEELRSELEKLGYTFKDLKDCDFLYEMIISRSAREIHGNNDIFTSIRLFSDKNYYILNCYVKEINGIFYHIKFIHKATYNVYAHRKNYSQNKSNYSENKSFNNNFYTKKPPTKEQEKKYKYLALHLHPDRINDFHPGLDQNIFKEINSKYQSGDYAYIEREYNKYYKKE